MKRAALNYGFLYRLKKFLKYLSILVVMLILFGVAAYYLARKFEPEVRSVVVNELNKHLAVPVQVEDINLSLIQHFPYASLRFSNVVIPQIVENEISTDTLIYIKDMYLQIGLLNFFRKEYKITEAELNTGYFDMKFFPGGGDNFHFWKESSDRAGGTSLSLKNVEINDFGYHITTADGLEMIYHIEEADASGNFGEVVYDIESSSKIQISSVVNQTDTLYQSEFFEGDLSLNINTETGLYTFRSPEVEIAGQEVSLEGRYAPAADQIWNVAFKGENTDLEKLAHLLPLPVRKTIGVYSVTGTSDIDVKLSWGKDEIIDAKFSNLTGTFQHSQGLGKAEIIAAKGRIEIRNSIQSIFLDELRAKIGLGKIEAWGKIIDLSAPSFDLNVKGIIDLNELKSLLNMKLVDELAGKVAVDGHLQGYLPRKSSNATIELLRGMDFTGKINLSEGVFKMVGQNQKFDQISGALQLKGNAVIISSAVARVNQNPFQFSGIIKNALPYISQKGQKLSVIADFSADVLDFNKILATESTARDTTYSFDLPNDISFDLSIAIGRLDFRKFQAKSITGKAYYTAGLLTLNPVFFETASGSVKANIRVKEKSENRFEILANARLRQLDLPILFEEFENFGQEVVTASHLEGLADANIDFSSAFKKDLSIPAETIKADIDLKVFNGKVKHLKSLEAIGIYLRENALWRMLIKVDEFQKKLEIVSFDTLQNSINIDNRVIEIPTMTIGSSAVTLHLAGTHTFDNQIDYTLNFKLSDLLRTGREKKSEFGYIEEDESGLNVFMKMEGTVQNPIFSMDNDAARQKRKSQFKTEKTTFKNILKEEFGLFKSDTTLTGITPKAEKDETKFSIDWDDFKTKNDSSDKKTKKTKAKKKEKDLFGGDDDL